MEAIDWKIGQLYEEEQRGRALLQQLHGMPVPDPIKELLAAPVQAKIHRLEVACEGLSEMKQLIQQMEEDMRRSRP